MAKNKHCTDARQWMCITCGTPSPSPYLTDETHCQCNDIYEERWCKVPCTAAQRAHCDYPEYPCKWMEQQAAECVEREEFSQSMGVYITPNSRMD